MSESEPTLPSQPPSSIISKLLGQEAIAVLLISGLTYLYAFFFERAYFRYFGVDQVYVSIELTDLLVAATAIIFTLAFIIQIFWWIPTRALVWAGAVALSNVALIIVLVAFIFNFSRSGRNLLTTILLAVILIMLLFEIYFVIRHWSNGGTYGTYLNSMVEAEIKISESKVDHHIAKVLGSSVWFAVLFVIVFPAGFGTAAGNILASSKRTFLTIEKDTGIYALVGSYAGGLIFTKVQELENSILKIPADATVLWLSDNELSGVVLQQQRVIEGLKRAEPSKK